MDTLNPFLERPAKGTPHTTLRQDEFDQAESRYKSFLENALHGMAQSLPAGSFLSASPAYARMLGYDSPEDLIHSVKDIGEQLYSHPEERERIVQEIRERGKARHEILLKRRDGKEVWILASTRAVRNEAGETLYFESIIEDITERKNTLSALAQSEARLQLALNASHMGTWDWDLNSNTLIFSGVSAELFGMDATRSTGSVREILDLVIEEDRTRVQMGIKAAIGGNLDYSDEYRVRWPDGSVHWINARGRVLVDERGRPSRMVGTVLDVSDRKLAEEGRNRFEEELRKFKFLSDNAQDPFFLISRNGKLLYVNRSSGELLGHSLVSLYALDFFSISAMSPTVFHRYFIYSGEERQPVQETELIHQDGTRIPVDMQFSNLEFGGESLLFAIARDVRERKETELSLKQHADELVRSNKELEQFAYVSSHDLKEPLRMVTVFVELLKKHLEGKLDEEAEEYIGYVVQGSRRMLNLINDLLAYSQVGKELEAFTKVDCNLAAKNAIDNLMQSIKESAAELTVEPLPCCLGNPTQLTQLFQNLIANALKFRAAERPRISITVKKQDDHNIFSVTDNGIGISEKYQTKIFALFQRLHPANKYPGTGIGLTICKRIVETHGGRIWVNSDGSHGTTFSFSLPVFEDEPSKAEEGIRG